MEPHEEWHTHLQGACPVFSRSHLSIHLYQEEPRKLIAWCDGLDIKWNPKGCVLEASARSSYWEGMGTSGLRIGHGMNSLMGLCTNGRVGPSWKKYVTKGLPLRSTSCARPFPTSLLPDCEEGNSFESPCPSTMIGLIAGSETIKPAITNGHLCNQISFSFLKWPFLLGILTEGWKTKWTHREDAHLSNHPGIPEMPKKGALHSHLPESPALMSHLSNSYCEPLSLNVPTSYVWSGYFTHGLFEGWCLFCVWKGEPLAKDLQYPAGWQTCRVWGSHCRMRGGDLHSRVHTGGHFPDTEVSIAWIQRLWQSTNRRLCTGTVLLGAGSVWVLSLARLSRSHSKNVNKKMALCMQWT